MTNRYEIYAANPDGSFGQLMGLAEQKRLAFKEQVDLLQRRDEDPPGLRVQGAQAARPGLRLRHHRRDRPADRLLPQGLRRQPDALDVPRRGARATPAPGRSAARRSRWSGASPTSRSCRSTSTSSTPRASRCWVERAAVAPRQVHRPRARPARRLPGRRRDRGRSRRPDAALIDGAVPGGPTGRRGGGRTGPCGPTATTSTPRGPRPARRRCGGARGRRRGRRPRRDGVPCRLYRPARRGRDGIRRRRAPARRRLRLPRRRRPRRRGAPARQPLRAGGAQRRLPRPPEHRFPAAPDDVDRVLGWLADEAAGTHRLGGRTDVRPRRQRRRQPRAGRGAAPPGAVRGGRADLPVPRPAAGFDSYAPRPTASTRARRPGTGSSTPRRPPT